MSVKKAHADVQAAETALQAAQRQLDEARDRLDQALAVRGWRRLHGALSPDTRLYQQIGGQTIALAEVVQYELQQQAA